LSRTLLNLAEVELLAGRLLAACKAAAEALAEADRAKGPFEQHASHAYLASALARLGRLNESRRHFAAATRLERGLLYSLAGIWEAEFKRATGNLSGALAQTRSNRAVAERNQWTDDLALCDTLLGLLTLPDIIVARRHLDAAREYAARSGNVEIQLRCYELAAELARSEQAHAAARRDAEAGVQLADTCGFGHSAVGLRLALARVLLEAGDPRAALHRAREALERSVQPECQYAWGEADALHLCGVAYVQLGEVEQARQRLRAGVSKREQLTHPGLSETVAELDRLGK
jgi:hypothetical protein